jgi:hypothetical protein
MTKSRGILGPRHQWTPLQLQSLREWYPHIKTAKVAEVLGLPIHLVNRKAYKLGLKKTPEYMASDDACKFRRDSKAGLLRRFPKGNVPWNKGVKGVNYPGMEATQFKKGQHPYTWKPLGTERLSKEGYLQRKMHDTGVTRRDYVAVHHLLWRQHHGEIPDGHKIAFKDGNKQNVVIGNLELVSHAEMMKRNTIHNLPEELKEVLTLKGALNRRITCHERNKNK